MLSKSNRFNFFCLILILILVIFYLIFRFQIDFDKISHYDLFYQKVFHLFKLNIEEILKFLIFGAALSVSGLIYQKTFSNHFLDSFTLGISSISFLVFNIFMFLIKNEFISIIYTILLTIIVNNLFYYYLFSKKISVYNILFIELIINLFLISLIEIFCYLFDMQFLEKSFFSYNFVRETNILFYVLAIFAMLCIFLFYKFGDVFDIISLGEENFVYFDNNIKQIHKKIFLLTSILVGISFSYIGILGFIGIIIPYTIRIFFKNKTKNIIFSVAFLGGFFLLLSNFLSKTLFFYTKIPLGVINNIIIGIFFIFLVLKTLKKGIIHE